MQTPKNSERLLKLQEDAELGGELREKGQGQWKCDVLPHSAELLCEEPHPPCPAGTREPLSQNVQLSGAESSE